MSIRSVAVVILALVCGASAAVGVSQLRQSAAPDQVVEQDKVPVVVASREIPRGTMLTSDDLRTAEWLKESVPEGAVTTTQEAVGRGALTKLLPGEPILNVRLAAKGVSRGLSTLIPKGKRLYTIKASSATTSVAGFVQPEDTVDVLLNTRGQGPNDDTGGGQTNTLLQAVEVWAVEQRLETTSEGRTNYKEISAITLLVSPDDANKLDVGQSLGQLSLTLRNPDDRDAAKTRIVTVNEVRGFQGKPAEGAKPEESKPAVELPPIPVQEEEPRVFQIVTLRGNERGRILVQSSP